MNEKHEFNSIFRTGYTKKGDHAIHQKIKVLKLLTEKTIRSQI